MHELQMPQSLVICGVEPSIRPSRKSAPWRRAPRPVRRQRQASTSAGVSTFSACCSMWSACGPTPVGMGCGSPGAGSLACSMPAAVAPDPAAVRDDLPCDQRYALAAQIFGETRVLHFRVTMP